MKRWKKATLAVNVINTFKRSSRYKTEGNVLMEQVGAKVDAKSPLAVFPSCCCCCRTTDTGTAACRQ